MFLILKGIIQVVVPTSLSVHWLGLPVRTICESEVGLKVTVLSVGLIVTQEVSAN